MNTKKNTIENNYSSNNAKVSDDKNVGKQSVRRKKLTFLETKPQGPKTQ